MTNPKGNSEFCFPESLDIQVEGKQNSVFPRGQSLSDLLHLPTQKYKNRLLDAGWLTNLPRFQGARAEMRRMNQA